MRAQFQILTEPALGIVFASKSHSHLAEFRVTPRKLRIQHALSGYGCERRVSLAELSIKPQHTLLTDGTQRAIGPQRKLMTGLARLAVATEYPQYRGASQPRLRIVWPCRQSAIERG